ncbi:MAG: hypothetical protein ACYDEX_15315 [Mobilitalea sp.]
MINETSYVESNSTVTTGGGIGFSSRINDPAFKRYIKNTNRYSGIFSIILAVVAIVGFTIYGEKSDEMNNPEAMYIGLIIGGMFLLISLFTTMSRKRSKTWDGTIIDKTIKKKRRKQSAGSNTNDYYWVDYIEYVVVIKEDTGKKHEIKVEDDDTLYIYYQIGNRVRHHGQLNSYEKYDKSKDSIIFCNACATLNEINEEYCHRCKCPLLK